MNRDNALYFNKIGSKRFPVDSSTVWSSWKWTWEYRIWKTFFLMSRNVFMKLNNSEWNFKLIFQTCSMKFAKNDFNIEFIKAWHFIWWSKWREGEKAQATLSARMKYSKNSFQFSNGIRAINYSRFIIVTNGKKILFLVFR